MRRGVLKGDAMRFLGNVLWIVFGGLIIALGWLVVGGVLCLTIVGIPLGLQCFKAAELTLAPFGREVVYGGGVGSALGNFLWAITFGWMFALSYVLAGIFNCVTIIGIPFGMQAFKLAKLAWAPFGAEIL